MDVSPPPTSTSPPPPPGRYFPGPAAALAWFAAVSVLGLCLALTQARADDTIRRIQEELRRRNLYFGDIDGQRNRGILGALRRYQERKGFPVTGEVDAITLRSLNIAATPDSSESGEDPWPEIPILKSDQGRRPPPLGAHVINEEPPSGRHGTEETATGTPAPASASGSQGGVNPGPNGGPPVVMERGTPQMAESNSAATPAPTPPADRPKDAGFTLTPEAARSFIESYLRAGATNDTRAEMSFYGDVVDYFNKGPAGREYIARDVRQYYRRWPVRHFEILGPVKVDAGPHAGESAVRFLLRYVYHGSVHGQDRQVVGCTDNNFILAGGPEMENLRIISMREQRVRP